MMTTAVTGAIALSSMLMPGVWQGHRDADGQEKAITR